MVAVTQAPTSPASGRDKSAPTGGSAKAAQGGGVLEADSYTTTARDGAVKLRMGSSGVAACAPITVPNMFTRTATQYPTRPALRYQENGQWREIDFRNYLRLTRTAANSFIKMGLEPFMSVGILGFNSKEWFLSNLGAIFAGGFGVGIYATNTPSAVQYIAHHSKARIIVVENDMQLQKVLKVEDELPDLKYIIQYSGTPSVKRDNLYSWKEFMSMSDGMEDTELDKRLAAQSPNRCCSLIYTSGTTGNPKGVMLSHDNLTWTAHSVCTTSHYGMACESLVSYLPLSHIAAQILDLWMPLHSAATVSFAQPDALKGSLATTLKDVQPTAFFGVPRVWEKIEDKLKSLQAQGGGLKKKLGAWATGVNLRGTTAQQNGQGTPFGSMLAGALVKKVRVGLGLNRAKFIYSGAAPISRDTVEYLAGLNVPVCEVYGLSETTGPETSNLWAEGVRAWKFGSAGRPLDGCITEIANPDAEGDGEVCMSGRNVFMGYMEDDEKTKEAFDANSRFRSGDVGRITKAGFLYITGRIKELLITAGGENVAPVPIEDELKAHCPAIGNCMLVGDKLKFLSMLICFKSEVDADGAPLDKLNPTAIQWLESVGSKSTTVSQLVGGKDAAADKALTAVIEAVNKKSESRAKKIAKFLVLPKDFSILGDELGPTLKLKRKVVMGKYEAEIAKLYEAAEGGAQ